MRYLLIGTSVKRSHSIERPTGINVTGMLRKVTRIIAAPALALSVLLGASLPVSAAVSLSDGRYATTSISCSQTYGQMIVSGTIKPASRYSSQSVAVRTFIQPTNGAAGFWNAWDSFRAPTDFRYTVNVRNANYTVYVQYGWYNGSTWSYAGEWIKSYGQFTLATRWELTYCAV